MPLPSTGLLAATRRADRGIFYSQAECPGKIGLPGSVVCTRHLLSFRTPCPLRRRQSLYQKRFEGSLPLPSTGLLAATRRADRRIFRSTGKPSAPAAQLWRESPAYASAIHDAAPAAPKPDRIPKGVRRSVKPSPPIDAPPARRRADNGTDSFRTELPGRAANPRMPGSSCLRRRVACCAHVVLHTNGGSKVHPNLPPVYIPPVRRRADRRVPLLRADCPSRSGPPGSCSHLHRSTAAGPLETPSATAITPPSPSYELSTNQKHPLAAATAVRAESTSRRAGAAFLVPIIMNREAAPAGMPAPAGRLASPARRRADRRAWSRPRPLPYGTHLHLLRCCLSPPLRV